MRFCYLDESGCTGTLPSATSPIQPVFVIAGLIVNQPSLTDLTHDFIAFKHKYFPAVTKSCTSYLEKILPEIKGSEIRKLARKSRNNQRFAFGVIDSALKILERHDVKVVGRVWIKDPGAPIDGRAIYTSSVQSISHSFQHFLQHHPQSPGGIVIADSRTKQLNSIVAHSIFTQKFKATGDSLDKIHEMPLFGHSDNHAGIQLGDILCSALIFPIACSVYCTGYVTNRTHIHNAHLKLRDKFGARLEQLQYRYFDTKWRGGLIVSDPIARRNGTLLFHAPPAAAVAPAAPPPTGVAFAGA